MATGRSTIRDLNKRSRDIFTTIVDAYVETGEPIGSKTLSQILKSTLSPATLRNVMADLEDAGLLYSPHTSAGRLPTNAGLRIFVDGLLELGNLNNEDKSNLEGRVTGTGRSFEEVLEEATNTLSGLSNCAGIVLAPKIETPLKHIEFFPSQPWPRLGGVGNSRWHRRKPNHRSSPRYSAISIYRSFKLFKFPICWTNYQGYLRQSFERVGKKPGFT